MDELLSNALRDYKAEFGQDFDQSWQPKSEEDIAEKLQSSQKDFQSWRSRNARLWGALTATVLPISNLGRIASDAATAAFPPASAAMSGLMSLVTALTLDKINTLWQKALLTENASVVERLNSPAVQINNKAYAGRLDDKLVDSGQWFQREKLYQLWMQHDIQLLMLLGGPGSGKSYLATTLIEDLTQKYHRHNAKMKSTSVAYFFFEPDTELTTILRTMAYQIQLKNEDYPRHVMETFDEGNLYTTKEIWTKLFLDFWSDQVNPDARLMLVIDGLSEACPDAIESFVENVVKTVGKGSGYKIQIALFGMLRLWDYLDFIPREGFIEIDSKKNEEDISTYIDRQMLNIRALKNKGPQKKSELRNDILVRCDGVFEWARLLLSKCKNKEEHQIRKLLKNPPKGLDDMIKSCFDQIMADEDIDPDMLGVLLTWLTYEKRPLRFGELYNAICLATGEEYTLMWRNIVRCLSSIVRWRGSRNRDLIDQNPDDDQGHVEQLDEDQGWSKQTSTTWLSFANTQIRDYVLRQSELAKKSRSDSEPWPLPMQQSECDIVKVCLRTLQGNDILEKANRFSY